MATKSRRTSRCRAVLIAWCRKYGTIIPFKDMVTFGKCTDWTEIMGFSFPNIVYSQSGRDKNVLRRKSKMNPTSISRPSIFEANCWRSSLSLEVQTLRGWRTRNLHRQFSPIINFLYSSIFIKKICCCVYENQLYTYTI